MSIQALQQTGHATDGFWEFNGPSRVSRLLSYVVRQCATHGGTPLGEPSRE
jgi:hypothetical protein